MILTGAFRAVVPHQMAVCPLQELSMREATDQDLLPSNIVHYATVVVQVSMNRFGFFYPLIGSARIRITTAYTAVSSKVIIGGLFKYSMDHALDSNLFLSISVNYLAIIVKVPMYLFSIFYPFLGGRNVVVLTLRAFTHPTYVVSWSNQELPMLTA